MILSRSIDAAHPDIELGFPRSPIRYRVATPETGLGAGTGVFFYVHGYGSAFDDAYSDKMLTWAADRYNCIAVAVDYFGSNIHGTPNAQLSPTFFSTLRQEHGITIEASSDISYHDLLRLIVGALAQRGVTHLSPRCLLINDVSPYNNFGLLAALDHLQVLADILAAQHIDKRRIFLLGTSYGGYVAGMLLKLAPRTFRLLIDNSGFSCAKDSIASVLGYQSWIFGKSCAQTRTPIHWDENPAALNHFAEWHEMLRDLTLRPHVTATPTRLMAYHSCQDEIAPTVTKRRLVETYAGLVPYTQRIITQDDLDGRCFKSLTHGMEASLRGLAEMSFDAYEGHGAEAENITDFDLGSHYVFDCGELDFVMSYGPETMTARYSDGR